MVELAVILLNITTFLKQLGYGKTRTHRFFFYVTYVFWFVACVLLSLYCIYVLWMRVIPLAPHAPFCVTPATLCGHIIAAFCISVFVFVWTPDMLAKWRAPVLVLEQYPDYKLMLRQTMTPRSLLLPQSAKHMNNYGTLAEEPWRSFKSAGTLTV